MGKLFIGFFVIFRFFCDFSFCLFNFFCIFLALRQFTDSTNFQRSVIEQGTGGLWPKPFNTALKAKITANATCGENGPEEYCKMADIHHAK